MNIIHTILSDVCQKPLGKFQIISYNSLCDLVILDPRNGRVTYQYVSPWLYSKVERYIKQNNERLLVRILYRLKRVEIFSKNTKNPQNP